MRPQLGDVGQAVTTHRQRHRQIQQDLARIVAGQRRRHGVIAALNAASSPTVAAVRVSSTPPALETTF
jgi:hypothetical protein